MERRSPFFPHPPRASVRRLSDDKLLEASCLNGSARSLCVAATRAKPFPPCPIEPAARVPVCVWVSERAPSGLAARRGSWEGCVCGWESHPL
jgi:hypothetical protein